MTRKYLSSSNITSMKKKDDMLMNKTERRMLRSVLALI